MGQSIAPLLATHKNALDTMLAVLNAALDKATDPTERYRLEIAIKDLNRGRLTLNLIITDSR